MTATNAAVERARAALKGPKVLAGVGEETPASPMAEAPPAQPAAPETPAPETPGTPAPKFKPGDKVKSKDPSRKPGVVEGEPIADPYAYNIKTADGQYVETEGQMDPDTAPAQPADPMEQPAPAALCTALGLAPGAQMKSCIATAKATTDDRDGMVGDKTQALADGGVKADLADMAAADLKRNPGETWPQAVARHQAARPSLYQAKAAAPTVPQDAASEARTEGKPATEEKQEPTRAPIQGKLPAGVELKANTPTPEASTGTDVLSSWQSTLSSYYGKGAV